MKYLVVGLGNPGYKYEETRHNIGFKVVEALAKEYDASFSTERLGELATVKHKGRTVLLLKPNTFMNLSGKAVNYWMQQEKIPVDRILIITDDIALPFGKLRMKGKGSDGGHNGLKDIIAVLNSKEYPRLRFGVGSDFSKGRQVDYVLGEWSEDEKSAMAERLEVCKEFIKSFVTIGIERTMNFWNNK
ncbi:aminoacyl-tRNA hydrolase [Crocinitomix algicola]|uniref:aminoacyl-tRNA hydrolase n=1 Tax=Crocinitomix algicola TaxID=1740263 RepID=UPI000836BDF4|nr:aminoacyl-tRNA hydrolase [Crocinitomix algicola]